MNTINVKQLMNNLSVHFKDTDVVVEYKGKTLSIMGTTLRDGRCVIEIDESESDV